jgi:hypothetical protein
VSETPSPKEDTKESPRAAEPENSSNDNVAPEGQAQTGLFLKKLHEALQDDAKAKELEKDTGFSREQLEQFTRKYEKVASAPGGPGRDINLKGDDQKAAAQPSANLPGLSASTPFSSQSRRGGNTGAQDEIRGNVEGARDQPPPEMRGKWEGYQNKLAKVTAPPKRAPAPNTKGGK